MGGPFRSGPRLRPGGLFRLAWGGLYIFGLGLGKAGQRLSEINVQREGGFRFRFVVHAISAL